MSHSFLQCYRCLCLEPFVCLAYCFCSMGWEKKRESSCGTCPSVYDPEQCGEVESGVTSPSAPPLTWRALLSCAEITLLVRWKPGSVGWLAGGLCFFFLLLKKTIHLLTAEHIRRVCSLRLPSGGLLELKPGYVCSPERPNCHSFLAA